MVHIWSAQDQSWVQTVGTTLFAGELRSTVRACG
jgi:hypothetical protein